MAFLAVPDPAVPEVAEAFGTRLPVAASIVHVSGSLPLAAVGAARQAGHRTGSFHPFQSFPAVRQPEAFSGCLVGVDATDEELAGHLFQLALDIGGRARRVPDEQRALYHVAAVLSSNLVLGLAGSATSVLESIGWTEEEALDALIPLLSGVVENLRTEGLGGALIGPIRRGEAATVRRHLTELQRRGLEEPTKVYRILGMATLELALATGLDKASGEQIREALTG